MLSVGVDPADLTYKKAEPAFDKLAKAVDTARSAGSHGNDYQDDLVNGNFAACVAWSGDVAQLTLDNEDCASWSRTGRERWADTMVMIAVREATGAGCEQWMNYFYDPSTRHGSRRSSSSSLRLPASRTSCSAIDPGLGSRTRSIFPPDGRSGPAALLQPGPEPEDAEKFDERFAEIQGT